ncbi:MAG: hypothetical protein NVSMB4_03240 [Acidimicrobiales bacterium]
MIDLGDTVTLTWPGVPASATGTTVTVTLPDASTVTASVAPSQGTATYSYPTTQVGRHSVRWVCAGPDVEAYADGFEVAQGDPGFIISLSDAKTQLNMSSGTSNDEELRTWLGATTEIVEYFCGSMVVRPYTEVHDGGKAQITLYHAPVLSVSAVTEWVGFTAYNLTLQPYGSATSAYGFSLDNPSAGVITRRSSGSFPVPFLPGTNNVTVTYTAGRQAIPYSVQAAARLIVAHLWSTRRGAMALPGPSGSETSMVPGFEYAVPIKAIELMERWERMGGIA